ncbi:hypothetical protein [Peptoniphilus sp.]|jgi:hypothetical protein|uniref:hypothetical protein n=1 Tax=Peptoniphilus sp. TaxID=1971214 RepID=UPI003D90365E
MNKYIINFYNKNDRDKATVVFLIYLISGILFLSIGEMPEIYTFFAVINIKILVPFLLGFLIFLPRLFKNNGHLSYLLIFLFIPQIFWIYLSLYNFSFYIPLILGIIFGFYTSYTIKSI